MRVLYVSLMMSSLLVGAGCGDAKSSAAASEESASRMTSDYVQRSFVEADLLEQLEPAPAPAPKPAPAPRAAPRPAPEPTYRPVETVYAPQPRVVTQTNVKRDAAIGAGVGAVAGAIAHGNNRWKGAVVGGVIGGAAGAIVGATIDKSTKVIYP